MISLKQIHYALAVERTLHFKKAAEACNISQSALSTALSEMEKQLGFQIFERDNRKVLVTPLGQQVLEKARAIELQMDDLQKLAEARQSPLSTPMTIGVIPTIGPYLLPRVLPELQARYPQMTLDIVEDQSAVLVDQLRRGALDAAILALPYDCDGLLSFPFWEENFYWIGHPDDELAHNGAINSDDLAEAKLILLKEGHCLSDHAIAACRLQTVSSHAFSATSLPTLIQLVAANLGSTLVPEMALEQLVNHHSRLCAIPLDEAGPHRSIAFVVRPNYPLLNNVQLLMELFSAELKQTL